MLNLMLSYSSLVKEQSGPYRARTGHLVIANDALYQMS